MRRGWTVALALALGVVLAGCGLFEQVPALPPAQAPAGVAASVGKRLNSIEITWQPVERATFYEIERDDTEAGPYARVGTSPVTSFQDGVSEQDQGKWFWYRVRACNAAGCGPWSDPARGYAGRPPKPENVQASDGTHRSIIRIEWDSVPGALYYQLFRDPSPDPNCRGLCPLADDLRANYYEDHNVRAGVRYTYAVRACNMHGCSELSDKDSGCVEPCPVPLWPGAE